jgi:hypothetical protein
MVANGILFSNDELEGTEDSQKENKMHILENLFKKLQFDKKSSSLSGMT